MKKIFVCIGGIFVIGISFWAGVFWEKASSTYKAEEMIAKEIRLLTQYRGIPSCETIRSADAELVKQAYDSVLILWKYQKENRLLKKAIIDKELVIAYEEKVANCRDD